MSLGLNLGLRFRRRGFGGGGIDPNAFVMTVETTGSDEGFTIPCVDIGTYNATINWGDGQTSEITTYDDSDLTHTYATAGTHTISVTGTLPAIAFDGDSISAAKVRTVERLGDVGWIFLRRGFRNCTGMTTFNGDGDTSNVTNFSELLFGCSALTSIDVTGIDTSSAQDMSRFFNSCSSAVGNIVGVSGFNIEALDGTGDLNNFLFNSGLSTSEYDAVLIEWAAQTVLANMTPNFGSSTYTSGGAAEAARTSLVNDDGWTITDGGAA